MEKTKRRVIAVQVLPNVWIGNRQSSRSDHFFKDKNIKAVVNMTPNDPCVFKASQEIEYIRIPVYDSKEKRDLNLLYSYFPVICEFIYKNSVIEHKDVLVHCHQGKQRSAAAVAAYMIKYYRMTPAEAMEHLIKHKEDVFAYGESVNFAASLNRWYRKITSP